MSDFQPADEAQRLAETNAIPNWHPDCADASICYLLTTKRMKSKGRHVWAKVRKTNPVEQHLTGHDLIIIIDAGVWARLDEKKRLALLDHELCHVEKTEDEDTGDIGWRLVGHDIEEFRAVVSRHGMWADDIVLFDEALRQHTLPLDGQA